MKERPIIFSDAMVRAILEGRKTQTRRVVKPQPSLETHSWNSCKLAWMASGPSPETGGTRQTWGWSPCPFGQPGDRLWVRECWSAFEKRGPFAYRADTDGERIRVDMPWKPSIHMPRKASRITLEITGVRVERLQDICTSDAWAEGVSDEDIAKLNGSVEAFSALWQSIYGAESWQSNPWVWAIDFRVLP